MQKRIKKIFLINFLGISSKIILSLSILFSALFTLEAYSQKELYFENTKREVQNLQINIVLKLEDMIKWLNFYKESKAILSAYDGDIEMKRFVYENFKGWAGDNEILTSIVLYDQNGKDLVSYSEEIDKEKYAGFLEIKDNMIKVLKKDEYHMINKLSKNRDNTYFLHFTSIYHNGEKKGYIGAVGDLNKLMQSYEKKYRKTVDDTHIGVGRIVDNKRIEGVLFNEEKQDLEIYVTNYRKGDDFGVTEEGDYVVLSKNFKEMLKEISPLKNYNIKHNDGDIESTSIIVLKKEIIIDTIFKLLQKYMIIFLTSGIIVLILLYKYLKITFKSNLNQKRLNVKARKLDRNIATINTIVSVVGHDIKGPFSSLLGMFSLINLKKDRLEKEKLAEYLKIMENECRKGSYFSDNLMKWAIEQSDVHSYNPKYLIIYDIVKKQVDEYIGMAELKKIDIKIDIPQSITCYSDYEILRTIVRNILINSIKFTPIGGNINIEVEDQGLLKLVISDTGIGMNEQTIKKLQSKGFYTTLGSNGELGNGIGFYLVKKLCKINKGSLKIKSELGKGTRIYISVPRKDYSLKNSKKEV